MKLTASVTFFLVYLSGCKAYFPFKEPPPLNCYECSQASQFRCINLIEISKNVCPRLAEDMESGIVKNVCIKTVTINRNVNNSHPAIDRKCGTLGPGTYDTCATLRTQAKDLTCYSCDSNLCNESSKVHVNLSIFLTAVILLVCLLVW